MYPNQLHQKASSVEINREKGAVFLTKCTERNRQFFLIFINQIKLLILSKIVAHLTIVQTGASPSPTASSFSQPSIPPWVS